jgi:hypothetical protein
MDLKATAKMAADRSAKYLGKISRVGHFSDEKLNKKVRLYYFDSLLRYYLVPHIAVGL